MSIRERIGLRHVLLAAFVVAALGCGSGTSNDQGASFLALGFFDSGDAEAGDSGTVVYVNETVPGSQGVYPLFVPVDKDPSTPELEGGFIGLQNRLATQFIRTQHVDCCYYIPGADASLNIPCDSYNVTTVLDPMPTADEESEGGEEAANTAYVQIQIVSPDLLSFLSVNQNALPELPYRMTAVCDATGITQAGKVLVTNEINYQIQFADLPREDIVTGGAGPDGSGTTPGTGGELDTFGDADDENLSTGDGTGGVVEPAAADTGSSGDVLAREDAELAIILDEIVEE